MNYSEITADVYYIVNPWKKEIDMIENEELEFENPLEEEVETIEGA